ncbi:RNA-guided endonuclease InsQ/TnpB family protein [Argonema galeatum]|uniref:RNA-guided endonuclease InsQ/TnpB family protein n=1 Tax=Argonema galeatum TaxID=2942762 RepID=UPI002012F680|nr:transposase [Argonema galeatum]MCL1467762.1 transposase [Argonema galeatum A003/A1]
MLLAYNYRLDPSLSQEKEMEQHVEMLRLQYNFRVREREQAYRQAVFPVMGDYCDIYTGAECTPLTCSVSKNALYGNPWATDKKGVSKKRNALAQQDADLPNLKCERTWYKRIQHHVLQQMLRRVDDAFKRFFQGLGKFPKPKRRGQYHSFSYPPGDVRFTGNKVRLPGIGWMRFYQSRLFPYGFKIRTVTVKLKSDGWYISVRLEDESVPNMPLPSEITSAIGIDLGINKILSISTGEIVNNPKFYTQQERRRNIRSRAASRKIKGSKNRRKAYKYLALIENKVANQRQDFQWKLAHKLNSKTKCCMIFEDLNVKGMMKRCSPKIDEETGKYVENGQSAKTGLNRAIWDASWASLKEKVKVIAAKLGNLFHETNPRYSSQECSVCGYISPTNRDKEKFVCESCGHIADADVDAAVVIRQRGLAELGIKLQVREVIPELTPKDLPNMNCEQEHQQQYVEPGKPLEIKH